MAKVILNIARSYSNGFIANIEKTKYFQLQKATATRGDLYNFAIAIALAEGKDPQPISETGAVDTFVRTEYLNNYEAFFSSLYYEKQLKDNPDNIDDICNKDDVYTLAEQYANAGFGVLKDWTENLDEETLFYKLVSYMDKKYDEIKDELSGMI